MVDNIIKKLSELPELLYSFAPKGSLIDSQFTVLGKRNGTNRIPKEITYDDKQRLNKMISLFEEDKNNEDNKYTMVLGYHLIKKKMSREHNSLLYC